MEGNVSETLISQAFTPVAILLISWTFRIQDPNKRLAMIVLMISTGVALASHGEMKFNLFGFLIQAAAVAVRIDHS
jgi:drug/metabolite transporter (DMT)-like permease